MYYLYKFTKVPLSIIHLASFVVVVVVVVVSLLRRLNVLCAEPD